MIIFVWGLPGAGKSTVGRMLAEKLNLGFYEMDDYLPDSFKEKMKSGKLITDEDRDSFFSTFTKKLKEIDTGKDFVVSGYVAKKRHRDQLKNIGDLRFFELVADRALLTERLKKRKDHFFEEETLKKVLKNYEPLNDSVKIDAEKSIAYVVKQIIDSLN
ncbi:AAA family ATPase [Patescibacteria group bacterium]|nr:AAA family ATPase [Patescibacteria group bacterium]MCA9353204.1 AAA family ATPase [Patescibacteria group bacterium]HRX17214.1 shikimate kinase [Spirochaetota bacterium]